MTPEPATDAQLAAALHTITEWTVLHEAFETAEDAPRFRSEAAAEKFTARFGGVPVGLADVRGIS